MVVAYNMGEWREIPRAAEADEGGHQRLAGHVRADRVRRPDGRRRGRHGPGGAAVHPQGVADDDRVARDDGLRRRRDGLHILQDKHIPDYVTVFRIHGPFLFGATDKIAAVLDHADALPPIVILRLRNMTAIDAHRAAGARGSGRRTARDRPHADPLRRAETAGAADAAGRIPRARRRARTSARTSRRRCSGRRRSIARWRETAGTFVAS